MASNIAIKVSKLKRKLGSTAHIKNTETKPNYIAIHKLTRVIYKFIPTFD